MKLIDIVRGYRTFGHEDVYVSDPTTTIQPGDVIGLDGKKATLDKDHKECAVAVEKNTDYSGQKPSGKIPVYVSNFVIRYYKPVPDGVAAGDPVTVINGQPAKTDADHTVVWGYVTRVTDSDFDVRVNY